MIRKSFKAGEDLKPYRFATLSADGEAVKATEETTGILIVTGELEALKDEVIDAYILGLSEIEVGGAIPAGAEISVDAEGRAVKAEGGRVAGYLLDAAATAAGQVVNFVFMPDYAVKTVSTEDAQLSE